MEVSRIGRNGQVTIPKNILNLLNLKEGDSVAFVVRDDQVFIMKERVAVFNELADEISKLAKEKGITEEDLLKDLERIRKEMWYERYRQ